MMVHGAFQVICFLLALIAIGVCSESGSQVRRQQDLGESKVRNKPPKDGLANFVRRMAEVKSDRSTKRSKGERKPRPERVEKGEKKSRSNTKSRKQNAGLRRLAEEVTNSHAAMSAITASIPDANRVSLAAEPTEASRHGESDVVAADLTGPSASQSHNEAHHLRPANAPHLSGAAEDLPLPPLTDGAIVTSSSGHTRGGGGVNGQSGAVAGENVEEKDEALLEGHGLASALVAPLIMGPHLAKVFNVVGYALSGGLDRMYESMRHFTKSVPYVNRVSRVTPDNIEQATKDAGDLLNILLQQYHNISVAPVPNATQRVADQRFLVMRYIQDALETLLGYINFNNLVPQGKLVLKEANTGVEVEYEDGQRVPFNIQFFVGAGDTSEEIKGETSSAESVTVKKIADGVMSRAGEMLGMAAELTKAEELLDLLEMITLYEDSVRVLGQTLAVLDEAVGGTNDFEPMINFNFAIADDENSPSNTTVGAPNDSSN